MNPPLDMPLASDPPHGGDDPGHDGEHARTAERDAFGLTAGDHAAMARVDAVRAKYGLDFERELADLEGGRHPLQQPRG